MQTTSEILNCLYTVLHNNLGELEAATSVASLVVTVQQLTHQAEIADTPPAKALMRAIMSSDSKNKAMQHVYRYMS